MKREIIIRWIGVSFILLSFTLPALAQMPHAGMKGERMQQIETVKIAFITRKLDLSTDEAKQFWPVYNNYQKELEGLILQKRQAKKATNTDADAQLNGELDFEGRLLDLRKKYRSEFSKVIPAQKVVLLYQAEREFREQLIKQLKERRQN